MNKDYDEYLCGGYSIIDGKSSTIKMPPESAKDTSKEGLSISIVRGNYMTIPAPKHKCRGSKDGKVSNRILRDGRNIQARRNAGQEQGER